MPKHREQNITCFGEAPPQSYLMCTAETVTPCTPLPKQEVVRHTAPVCLSKVPQAHSDGAPRPHGDAFSQCISQCNTARAPQKASWCSSAVAASRRHRQGCLHRYDNSFQCIDNTVWHSLQRSASQLDRGVCTQTLSLMHAIPSLRKLLHRACPSAAAHHSKL